MKKLILSIALVLFMGIEFVSASEIGPKKSYVMTNKQLTSLLSSTTSVGELENQVIVKVKITITDAKEIVVLNTNSTNDDLNYYIKKVLNYEKLNSNELAIGKNYVFDVNFNPNL